MGQLVVRPYRGVLGRTMVCRWAPARGHLRGEPSPDGGSGSATTPAERTTAGTGPARQLLTAAPASAQRGAALLRGPDDGPADPLGVGALVDEDHRQCGAGASVGTEHGCGDRPDAGDHLAVRAGPADLAGHLEGLAVTGGGGLGHEEGEAGRASVDRVPDTRPVHDV